MVNAKLHMICGNCGCDHMFKYRVDREIEYDNDDQEIEVETVSILCENCATLHFLDENAEKRDKI